MDNIFREQFPLRRGHWQEPFQKDDKARFIVFKRIGKEVDWRNAVASEPFVIEDEVQQRTCLSG